MKLLFHFSLLISYSVAPLVGAWIEIDNRHKPLIFFASLPLWERGLKSFFGILTSNFFPVAPLVGAWIEIDKLRRHFVQCVSLPLWERGLKFTAATSAFWLSHVAPLVGAWIEIKGCLAPLIYMFVAPLVGAWIEITSRGNLFDPVLVSLPLWERGLKSSEICGRNRRGCVAPLVGAWIEIIC